MIINTIFCGNYNQGISGMWQDGTHLGDRDHMTINQNKKVVHVVTPYDTDIIILNKKLNKNYIYYENKGSALYEKQAIQDSNASSYYAPVSEGRTINKSKRFYKNSSWDLVDKSEDTNVDYSTIKRENLPKELKKWQIMN